MSRLLSVFLFLFFVVRFLFLNCWSFRGVDELGMGIFGMGNGEFGGLICVGVEEDEGVL